MHRRIGGGKKARQEEVRRLAAVERQARKASRAEEKEARKAAKLAAKCQPKKATSRWTPGLAFS